MAVMEQSKLLMDIVLTLTFMYESYYDMAYKYQEETQTRYSSNIYRDKHDYKRANIFRIVTKVMFRVIAFFHIFIAIKYLFLGLLYLDWFEEYRVYDCFILGRVSFSTSSYFVTIVMTFSAVTYSFVYRFVIYNRIAHSFNFELFRFIQLDSDEVLWNEIQLKKYHRAIQRRSTNVEIEDTIMGKLKVRYSCGKIDHRRFEPRYGKFKFLFKNPFQPKPDQPNSILLRLNRTTHSWHSLRKTLIVYYPMTSFVFICIGVMYGYLFLWVPILSEYGFHIKYENCIKHIKSLSPEESAAYSYIYHSNLSDPPSREVPSVPIMNFYHIARLTFDCMENAYVWVDTYIAFTIYTSFISMQVMDLLEYLTVLERKLHKTISIMRCKSSMGGKDPADMNPVRLKSLIGSNILDQDPHLDELEDCSPTTMQAHILDYLRLVGTYQSYARYQTIFGVWIMWIAATAGISFWLAVHKFEDLQGEFRWGQIILAFIAVSCMSISAYFESRSRKLYHLISVAMAVDSDLLITKPRWCYLMQYYFPKPLYCFSAFDDAKFSWILCFQVSGLQAQIQSLAFSH